MRLDLASSLFLIATAIYLAVRIYFKRRMADTTGARNQSNTGDMALVALVVAGQIILPLLAIASPTLAWAHYRNPVAVFTWIGAAAMGAGLWLFWRSHADLGTNWSVTLEVQKGHTLVRTGIYGRIRHPMYASFFTMAVGQLLLVENWIAGPSAVVAVTALYLIRTPKEEAMLMAEFGDDYRRYMKSTGGVIPRLRAPG